MIGNDQSRCISRRAQHRDDIQLSATQNAETMLRLKKSQFAIWRGGQEKWLGMEGGRHEALPRSACAAFLRALHRLPLAPYCLTFLQKVCLAVQGSAKRWSPECCRQSHAEVASKNSNKIHQTWEQQFSRALHSN